MASTTDAVRFAERAAAANEPLQSLRECGRRRWIPRILDAALVGSLLAGLSWFSCCLAMQRFDFFDMSMFMDAGYRIYRGQRIYSDFAFNAGPIHPYLHAFSFAVFGFTKAAVLAHLCAVNGIVLVAAYILARRSLSPVPAALLAIVVSVCFFITVAHPWYDQNASAFLIAAVVIFRIFHPFPSRRSIAIAPAACGALVAFSFLTKSNIGAAGAAVLGLAFLVDSLGRRRLQPIGWYIAGGLSATCAIVLTLHSPGEFIYQTMYAYSTRDRLEDWSKLRMSIEAAPLWSAGFIVAVSLALGGLEFARAHLLQLVLVAGTFATAVFATWTGSMIISANITLFGFAIAQVILLTHELPIGEANAARNRRWVLRFPIAAAWVLAASFTWTAYDRRLSAWDWRPSNLQASYELQTPAFRGWKCYEPLGVGVDHSVSVINQYVSKQATLFVFPDVTIIYGLTGHEHYPGSPFNFSIRIFPPPGRILDEFRARFLTAPPDFILLHVQTEAYICHTGALVKWLGLTQIVRNGYEVIWREGDFLLLKARHYHGKPPAAAPAK